VAAAGGPIRPSYWIVRESEREDASVAEVAKRHGITDTTLFRWRRRFGGLEAKEAAELRQLRRSSATSIT
jgi:putative transposase